MSSIMCQSNSAKTEICRLLQWNEMQYATLQYNMGLQYLCIYFSDHKPTIDMMQRSRLFWCWWKNKWMQRDLVFIEQFNALPAWWLYKTESRVYDYYSAHDSRDLVHTIRPGVVITNEIIKTKKQHYAATSA